MNRSWCFEAFEWAITRLVESATAGDGPRYAADMKAQCHYSLLQHYTVIGHLPGIGGQLDKKAELDLGHYHMIRHMIDHASLLPRVM